MSLHKVRGLVKKDLSLNSSSNVIQALVNVYKDLFRFYLEAITAFAKARFTRKLLINMINPVLPSIISDFNDHMETLEQWARHDIWVGTQDILDEQTEALSAPLSFHLPIMEE